MGMEKNPADKFDAEYEYTGEQLADEPVVSPPPAAKPTLLNRILKNRRILIPLLLVIAIAVVYQFLGKNKAADDRNLANLSQSTASITADTNLAASSASQDLSPNDLVRQEIDKLAQQTSQDNTQVNALQSDIQRLNTVINQQQTALTALNSTVNALRQDMQQMRNNKPVVKEKKAVAKAPAKPQQIFYLKAVVPGRAWLVANSGDTTTVKVGDNLPGYGRVTAINTSQGWVGTSSGLVIQYGPDDS